jgi:hypothetical protein
LGRTIAPSASAWHRSGDLLSDMARQEGLEVGRVSKSFASDVLLALSCREAGCVLITDNEQEFRRISRYVQFDFHQPVARRTGALIVLSGLPGLGQDESKRRRA